MGTGRRTFLKLAASMLCARGASAQTPLLRDLPTLDAELAYDSATRQAAANDWGREIYSPHAPVLSRQEWQRHYGAQTWQRFITAKRRFDPNDVLTPGAGVFGVDHL